jgi:diguanylate cyclase (GGDEF)-like protein
MNIALLPDLAAMASLLTILYFLRRRHLQEGVGLWIIGLLFIFVEAIAYAFYQPSGPLHIPSHAIALDSYVAAGVIFLWAAAKPLFPRRQSLIYLSANTATLLILETAYAFDVHQREAYRLIAGCGLAVGLALPFLIVRSYRLGRAWWLIVVQLLLWLPIRAFGSASMFRDAAYYPLFFLYLLAAIVFSTSLPKESLGKVVIVAGFIMWSMIFLLHSWISTQHSYIALAAEVWDWQKFLVTIGMLLVLLERQVAVNEWHALHDQLTGLANRRCFEDKLDQAIKHSQRTGLQAAVVMIDLNGFKAVNDTRGHETGDRLLQFIAKNLQQVIRRVDTLARLGGDEFILLLTNLPTSLTRSEIVAIANLRVSESLSKPFTFRNEGFVVSASVGVSIYPADTTDEVLLRRLADQRMYEQKAYGPVVEV